MLRDFIIASVGGQGGLLATTVLSSVFMGAGYDVKTSEIHGMAQRGGTVTSYVRRGERVCSPVVPHGGADLILGLEMLEAYRELPNLRSGGIVLCSDERIEPVSVIMGSAEYPQLSRKSFLQRARDVYIMPAIQIAARVGNLKTSNVVCLGALSAILDESDRIPPSMWEEKISQLVPKKTIGVNLDAFRAGRKWLEEALEEPLES